MKRNNNPLFYLFNYILQSVLKNNKKKILVLAPGEWQTRTPHEDDAERRFYTTLFL